MDYHKQASDAAVREDWSAVEQALMEMVEGIPTDLAEPYRLPVEASTEENIEKLEAYYRENVGSPTDGGPGAALMSEQYALEEGDREQFEEFRSVLGENAPESLEEFLDLKYNEPEKWDYTKRLTEYMRKYPNSSKKYFDVGETLKVHGIQKGVALPPVQKQAFILPSGRYDPYHIMHRMKERYITDDEVRSYMADAKVMFVQWNGQRQMFISDVGICVITKEGDDWIYKTAWKKNDNNEEIDKIMKVIKNVGL